MSDNEMWEALQDEELPDKFVERLDSDASIEEKRSAFDRLMERAKVVGPNKDKAKEFLAQDDSEPTEADEPTTLVGTMTAETAAVAAPSGHGHTTSVYAPGGMITSHSHTGSSITPSGPLWGTTTTSPTWVTPAPAMPKGVPTSAAKPKKVEQVPMPPKFTEKVLIAFLEEQEGMEDKLVWAAHLLAQHFEMRLEDGEIRLVMEFSLRDHYDNNPSED